MTSEQFWDGDPSLPKYYRKAYELQRKRRNEDLWLQGMYIYEALCDVSPVLHAFAKKGTRATPYSTKPYPLNDKQSARDKDDKQRKLVEKGKRIMEAKMAAINKKFKGKTPSQ